jgi:DNA-binding GntR family transcriptional regulator
MDPDDSPDNPTRAIYDQICAAIVDHRLAPGTKLREAELSSVFGVSRTLVRQALIQLGQDGIVVLRHNRGAEVAQPSRDDGHHIFVAREVLEGAIARQLAHVHRAEHLRELRALAKAEAAALARNDYATAITLSGTFHLRMAQMAGNPVLAGLLAKLIPQTSLLISLYHAPGSPMCESHDHVKLIEAVGSGEPARAALEMRKHLQEIEQRLTPRAAPRRAGVAEIFGGGNVRSASRSAPDK